MSLPRDPARAHVERDDDDDARAMKRARKTEAARQRAIASAFMVSQGLGAVAVAVGALGLDGAVALCESRDLSSDLSTTFDALGYTVDHLPSKADIDLLLIGIEVKRRQSISRSNGKPSTPRDVVGDLCTPLEAARSFDVLESFGLTGILFHKTFDHAALGAI